MSNIKSLEGLITFELEQNAKEVQRQADLQRWQELLDWQKIYDWASAKPVGAVLGTSCTNTACPIAEYLNEASERPFWGVGPVIVCGDGRGITLDKPDWVNRLIKFTDEIAQSVVITDEPSLVTRHQKTFEQRPITREQFLRALEAVKQ